ncbi:single-stranded DNA-binding protein [Candidatus Saccharibacteria bacterium]|nr:single-stranded DNA-binding protein [Candidatus Saccharibacteria bacterium]
MARSFNQVVLMGNLTRDPELRTTPNGQNVCNFSLALNRRYRGADDEWKDATDYIDIVAWGSLGERVAQYLSKGRAALVSGRLQSRSWEQDGQKRSKVEVVALDVTFLGGPGAGPAVGASDEDQTITAAPATDKKPAKKAAGKAKKDDDVEIEDIGDEPINLDDIPF